MIPLFFFSLLFYCHLFLYRYLSLSLSSDAFCIVHGYMVAYTRADVCYRRWTTTTTTTTDAWWEDKCIAEHALMVSDMAFYLFYILFTLYYITGRTKLDVFRFVKIS
jgi:hypothetical protein